jgi:hypothetical protein
MESDEDKWPASRSGLLSCLAGTSGQFGFFGKQENLLSLWAVEGNEDSSSVTTLTELS